MFGISGALWGLLGLTFVIAATHSLAPDHWLGFVMLGRSRKWGIPRTLSIAAIAGTAHVATSVILGLLGVWLGATLAHRTTLVVEYATGGILIVFGFVFAYYSWRKGGHSHHGIPLVNRLFHINTKEAEQLMHVHDDKGGHEVNHEHDERGHDHEDERHHENEDACVHGFNDDHDHDHKLNDHGRQSKSTKAGYGLVAITGLTPCILLIPLALRAGEMGMNAVIATMVVFYIGTLGAILTISALFLKGLELIKMDFFEKYGEVITGLVLGVLGILVVARII